MPKVLGKISKFMTKKSGCLINQTEKSLSAVGLSDYNQNISKWTLRHIRSRCIYNHWWFKTHFRKKLTIHCSKNTRELLSLLINYPIGIVESYLVKYYEAKLYYFNCWFQISYAYRQAFKVLTLKKKIFKL